MPSFLDFMERVTNGPMVSEQEFMRKTLIPNVRKVVQEFGIHYNPKDPVPSDDGATNRLFEGAIEFLARTGLYCDATNRILHVDRKPAECRRVPLNSFLAVRQYEERLRESPSTARDGIFS